MIRISRNELRCGRAEAGPYGIAMIGIADFTRAMPFEQKYLFMFCEKYATILTIRRYVAKEVKKET